MNQALRDFVDGAIEPAEFEVHYSIAGGLAGETEAHVSGTGAFRLSSTVTAGRQQRSYDGQIDPEEVRELARTALRSRLWAARHVKTVPHRDDREARIAVTAGEETFSAVLWASEVDQVLEFAEVQEQLLELVRRVSGGEVLEVGR